MSSADYLIAFGIPALVATVVILWMALEQRRQWLAMKAIRQRVEIRLAFGVARQELFRLAANGDIDFEEDIFTVLYRLDSQVMRAPALGGQVDGLAGALAVTRALAARPATARCAERHAAAIATLGGAPAAG
jgi:predicted transcriptional regulator